MQDIPNLREITYELTTICGANCVMCARNKYSRSGQSMTREKVMLYTGKVVRAGYNAIILGGMGDPLAYPDIKWFLRYVKETYPEMSIRLTTTGQYLDEDMLQIVCENVDILKISNYGFTKPVYERVHRGSLVFEEVQKNLQRLVEYPGRRPYIIMSFLDMPVNHAELLPWVEYWRTKGLSEVNVWKQHNWGGHVGVREALSEQEVLCARLVNRHYKLWVDGCVSVCVFDCDRTLVLGDLNTQDFDQLNEKRDRIYRIHAARQVLHSDLDCRNCDQIFSRDNALLYLNENGSVLKDLIHGER